MHQRNAGLNSVLCRIAKEKGAKIGISCSALIRDEKGRMMGRAMQNIMLCQKYNVPVILASLADNPFKMRAPKDIISLGVFLGIKPEDAKRGMRIITDCADCANYLKKGVFL